jgi:hypothetical protein
MEILYNKNKLRAHYIFNDNINRVFLIFSNPRLYQLVHKKFMSNLCCLRGRNSLDSIGSEFEYTWTNSIRAIFRIEDIINTPNEKLINCYYYSVEPTDFRYHLIYRFIYNTAEALTYYSYELLFQTHKGLQFHLDNFNADEKLNLFKGIEKFLEVQPILLEQEESIVIPESFDKLWNIITNWKLFQKLVPYIAEVVDYYQNTVNLINAKFDVKFKNEVYSLVVKKCFKRDGFGEYILEMFKSMPQTPLHYLIFNVYNLNGQCLVVFKHKFIEAAPVNEFKRLSEKKRKILKTLRKSLQKQILKL